MRIAALLALVLLVPTPLGSVAGELRIAAWNFEHLNDTGGEGWLPRTGPGYGAFAGQVVAIGADIAAFQEVENAAARRVFPAPHWHVEMSSRPILEPPRRCPAIERRQVDQQGPRERSAMAGRLCTVTGAPQGGELPPDRQHLERDKCHDAIAAGA